MGEVSSHGIHLGIYTVSELEVRFLKHLEMIEKLNNFDITCLYLQEYKKEFAFSTKFHYFSDQKQHILHLKKQFFFKKFFWNFQKKIFHQISPNYDQKRGFPKIRKKKFWKKIFFFSHIFFENRNKIAKNRSINTMVTIPNGQDFEVFRLYRFFWIWASFTIINWQKNPKKFSNFFSSFKCQMGQLFVIKIVKFCWKCKFFFVYLKIQACNVKII